MKMKKGDTKFKNKLTLHQYMHAQFIRIGFVGSLTLCLPLDFHNPLHHSPLRLIFLSNFKILLVIVCHCVL